MTRGSAATRAMGASAPKRSSAPVVWMAESSRTPVMSITAGGAITSSFIRSYSVVPPARKRVPSGAAAMARTASAAVAARE